VSITNEFHALLFANSFKTDNSRSWDGLNQNGLSLNPPASPVRDQGRDQDRDHPRDPRADQNPSQNGRNQNGKSQYGRNQNGKSQYGKSQYGMVMDMAPGLKFCHYSII